MKCHLLIIWINIIALLALSNGSICNMTFAINNMGIIYIDGVQTRKLVTDRETHKEIFPCNSSVIAIHAWNVDVFQDREYNPAAIIGSSDDQSILTDTSWKCSNVPYSGWTSVEYDDSFWSHAISYGTRDEFAERAIFRTALNPNAHWIWLRQFRSSASSDPFNDMDVIIYCRKTLRTIVRPTTTTQTNIVDADAKRSKVVCDSSKLILFAVLLGIMALLAIILVILLGLQYRRRNTKVSRKSRTLNTAETSAKDAMKSPSITIQTSRTSEKDAMKSPSIAIQTSNTSEKDAMKSPSIAIQTSKTSEKDSMKSPSITNQTSRTSNKDAMKSPSSTNQTSGTNDTDA